MAQWLKPPDILVENKSSIPRTNYFFEKKKQQQQQNRPTIKQNNYVTSRGNKTRQMQS